MGVNSLSKTVTRQRRGCDLNPGPSAPGSSMLTTRLPSQRAKMVYFGKFLKYQKSEIYGTFVGNLFPHSHKNLCNNGFIIMTSLVLKTQSPVIYFPPPPHYKMCLFWWEIWAPSFSHKSQQLFKNFRYKNF